MRPTAPYGFSGKNGRRIAHTLWETEERRTEGCAVILPGFLYPADAPLTFYLKTLLSGRGWDVLAIDYRYNENREFLNLGDTERSGYLLEEQHLIADHIDARSTYDRYLLIGKSIGTTAAHEMLSARDAGFVTKTTGVVWLTPASRNRQIVELLEHRSLPSMYFIGTEDPFYDAALTVRLKSLGHVKVEEFEGAGHLLEDPQSIDGSIDNLKRVVSTVRASLGEGMFG